MKIIMKIVFTMLVLHSGQVDGKSMRSFADAREEIKITENTAVEICGTMVSVDRIWVNEGIIKADISIFGTTAGKSITGGYKKGDEIIIDEKSDCRYYINLISKSGLRDNFGFVILTTYIPLSAVQVCEENLIFYESITYKIDTLDWYISRIDKDDEVKYKAEVNASYNSLFISNFNLKETDILWMGECVYKLENIVPSGGNYKYNAGMLVFKKQEELL
ncbi:MAG: hypothetical protein ACRDFC_08655 [Ignavibacteria bacterium]